MSQEKHLKRRADETPPAPLRSSKRVTACSLLNTPEHEQIASDLLEDEVGENVHSCQHCALPTIEPPGSPHSAWRQILHKGRVFMEFVLPADRPTSSSYAKDGCLLFQKLLTDRYLEKWSKGQDFQDLVFRVHVHLDPFHFVDDIEVCLRRSSRKNYWAEFKLFAEEGDPAAKYLKRRPLDGDVASVANFEKARYWIRECLDTHQGKCAASSDASLPTRLVNVSHIGDAPTLHLTGGKGSGQEHYVALSYCWGGLQSIKLQRTNLESWSSGQPIEGLPRTIRDAIRVTRELGIRYLWVDSLCIVQDDDEDKAREIGTMTQVYANAYVTVAAASAASSEEGFLQRRVWSEPVFKIGVREPQGELGRLCFSVSGEDYSTSRPGNQPIHQRAWTLQEFILSPRILVYDTRQVRWVCRSTKVCGGWEGGKRFRDVEMERFAMPDRMVCNHDQTTVTTAALYEWRAIVQSYTARALSCPEDKLPAIAGIANKFGDVMQARYLAGLWDVDLAAQLLWYRDDDTSCPSMARFSEYRAPSWSWASIDGSIIPYIPGGDEEPKVVLIDIMNCVVRPLSSVAPFAGVSDGQLVIRGRVQSVEWLKMQAPTGSGELGGFFDIDQDAIDITSGGELDDYSSMTCLEVAIVEHTEIQTRVNGLLLIPAPTPGYYKRVGIFRVGFRLGSEGEDEWSNLSPSYAYGGWRRHFDRDPPRVITLI